MATNHTANYELSQWLSADQVLRTDFNADNAKLDVALAGKAEQTDLSEVQASIPRVAAGTCTGSLQEDGFQVTYSDERHVLSNQEGSVYHYLALG